MEIISSGIVFRRNGYPGIRDDFHRKIRRFFKFPFSGVLYLTALEFNKARFLFIFVPLNKFLP